MKTLTIVIPCYNEGDNLLPLVERIRGIKDSRICFLLVDNGSTDHTWNLLEELKDDQIKTLRIEKNQGYGHGIVMGLKEAKTAWIGWTHADLQTDPQDCTKALDQLEEEGFVKGKRWGRRPFDLFFTIGMSFFETLIMRMPLWDINAQPTIFPRTFFESWQDPPKDFSLDLYAYVLAKKAKLPVQRFPVYFGPRHSGKSHWNEGIFSKLKFIKRTFDFSFQLLRRL